MNVRAALLLALVACMALLSGCAGSSATLTEDVQASIVRFKQRDASMERWFSQSHGYAVFPSVGKAGIGIGGAHGRGQVFEQGQYIGSATLTQATIGFQLGGQVYSEVLFFETAGALEDFTHGNFELAAQASAVAATAGASADADYSAGVAIFTMAKGGLMYEATVGGQKFSFKPR